MEKFSYTDPKKNRGAVVEEDAAHRSIVKRVMKKSSETPMERSSSASEKMEQSSMAMERFSSTGQRKNREEEDAVPQSTVRKAMRRSFTMPMARFLNELGRMEQSSMQMARSLSMAQKKK